jgi:hypothetical protein
MKILTEKLREVKNMKAGKCQSVGERASRMEKGEIK